MREAPITVLETGTARGFSALCMAKALIDSNVCGKVVTFDVLLHNTRLIWNCIDDHEDPKTRQQLLSPWSKELSRVIFIQGWTKYQLQRTGLSRVHFVFLDAQHTAEDVMVEYVYMRDRQLADDIIVFDDVTPGFFDGVVKAIEQIESEGQCSIEWLQVSGERSYTVGLRL